MFRKALLALFLLVSSAFGNWPEPRVVILSDGATAAFVKIDGQVKLLSCAHRQEGQNWSVGEQTGFTAGDGSRGIATYIAVDAKNDCSILSFPGKISDRITPFVLASSPPSPGEKVWVTGFPVNGQGGQSFRCRISSVISNDPDLLVLQDRGTPGESGGPISNARGEIVGVLFGSPVNDRGQIGNTTLCATTQQVARLCNPYTFGANCQNGRCEYPSNNSRPVAPPTAVAPPQTQPPPQPTIDQTANCEKQEQEIKLLQDQLAALKKQVADYKECQCGDHSAEVDAKIMAAIANIKFPPQEKPQPVDIKQIASEVQKSLPPVYIRVDPRSQYQPVRPGQYVTLPLDKVTVQ